MRSATWRGTRILFVASSRWSIFVVWAFGVESLLVIPRLCLSSLFGAAFRHLLVVHIIHILYLLVYPSIVLRFFCDLMPLYQCAALACSLSTQSRAH